MYLYVNFLLIQKNIYTSLAGKMTVFCQFWNIKITFSVYEKNNIKNQLDETKIKLI